MLGGGCTEQFCQKIPILDVVLLFAIKKNRTARVGNRRIYQKPKFDHIQKVAENHVFLVKFFSLRIVVFLRSVLFLTIVI